MVITKAKIYVQKTSPQSYKPQIKLFPPFLAEQPGPGATLLGWPKSIYYIFKEQGWLRIKKINTEKIANDELRI